MIVKGFIFGLSQDLCKKFKSFEASFLLVFNLC